LTLRPEVKVGILVTASLAALLWVLNYLKGKDIFKSRNRYFAVYSNVDGLVSSNPVYMNGYRIGIIKSIDFMPDRSGRLLVTLLIEDNVFIARNSVARIFSSDLIGTKALRIDLGDNPTPLPDNDTLKAELEFSFAQVVGKQVEPLKDKAERLITTLDSLGTSLNQFFDPSTRSHLQQSIAHLNNTLASIDKLTATEQGKLYKMLDDVQSITSNLRENNDEINHIIDNFHEISDTLAASDFAQTIANADKVVAHTAEVMEKISNGQGTLGQLVNNDSLYHQVERTTADLDSLLKDLKANPKRYVHFSIFGRKGK
jgi:phospholipid/cholesterol/gamma-HCH transport system substrate-binding protein